MESEPTDLRTLYEYILMVFFLHKGDGLGFDVIIDKLRSCVNNGVLAVVNADDEQQSPEFTILREGKICLSKDKDAIFIEQKGENEENEMILVYLDNGRVMVSKGDSKGKNLNVINKLFDKGFRFDLNNMMEIPKYDPDFLPDEKNNNNVIDNVGSYNNINQFNELQNHQSNIFNAEENMNEEIEEDNNNVGNHDNNIHQFDEYGIPENMHEHLANSNENQYQRPQPHPWSNVYGLDLSCLDCCHCFGGQQSV